MARSRRRPAPVPSAGGWCSRRTTAPVTFGQRPPSAGSTTVEPVVDDDLAGLDRILIDARAAYGLSGCQGPTELTASVTIEIVDAELGPDASPVVVVIPTSPPVPSGGIQVCQTAQLLGAITSDGAGASPSCPARSAVPW